MKPTAAGYGQNIMDGYGTRFGALLPEDVDLWNVPTDSVDLTRCVAVYGSDLGECLAAVVDIGDDDTTARLIWSDADGEGHPIRDANKFALAVRTIVLTILPFDV